MAEISISEVTLVSMLTSRLVVASVNEFWCVVVEVTVKLDVWSFVIVSTVVIVVLSVISVKEVIISVIAPVAKEVVDSTIVSVTSNLKRLPGWG